MECPACGKALVSLEYESVEVDYCAACGGIWLNAGELELLTGRDAPLETAPRTSALREATRRCPECRRRMDKATTNDARPVTFDLCRSGHGMWFDRGELVTVLEQQPLNDGEARVLTFLHALFPQDPMGATSGPSAT